MNVTIHWCQNAEFYSCDAQSWCGIWSGSCSWSFLRSLATQGHISGILYMIYYIIFKCHICKLFNDGVVSTASPRWGFRKSARRSWRALSGQIWETRRAHPRPEVDFSNPRVLNGQKREPLALSQRKEFCLLSQRYVMCRPEVIPPFFLKWRHQRKLQKLKQTTNANAIVPCLVNQSSSNWSILGFLRKLGSPIPFTDYNQYTYCIYNLYTHLLYLCLIITFPLKNMLFLVYYTRPIFNTHQVCSPFATRSELLCIRNGGIFTADTQQN